MTSPTTRCSPTTCPRTVKLRKSADVPQEEMKAVGIILMGMLVTGCNQGNRPRPVTTTKGGIDTLKYFVSKSEVIAAGIVAGGCSGAHHVTGQQCSFEFLADACLMGSIPTGRVSVIHEFERYPGEEARFFERTYPMRTRVIVFLQRTGASNTFYTVDPYFGLMPFSEHMKWQLTKVISGKTRDLPREGTYLITP